MTIDESYVLYDRLEAFLIENGYDDVILSADFGGMDTFSITIDGELERDIDELRDVKRWRFNANN